MTGICMNGEVAVQMGGSGRSCPQLADQGPHTLTVCCSPLGTMVPAIWRNCTDISRTEAMSSHRPSNQGRRARRRSQLTEIRFPHLNKQQASMMSLSGLGQEKGLQPPEAPLQQPPGGTQVEGPEAGQLSSGLSPGPPQGTASPAWASTACRGAGVQGSWVPAQPGVSRPQMHHLRMPRPSGQRGGCPALSFPVYPRDVPAVQAACSLAAPTPPLLGACPPASPCAHLSLPLGTLQGGWAGPSGTGP